MISFKRNQCFLRQQVGVFTRDIWSWEDVLWLGNVLVLAEHFHQSLWHPGRAPGRHHMTIPESLTCFSDPKVFSLKFFPENEGLQNLYSSSCWCSFQFTVKLHC